MCNDDWFSRWIASVLASFTLLSRSSRRSVLRTAQAIQQCGSTESNWPGQDWETREFYDKLNLWNTAHWQGMKEQRNYVLQTLNAGCGFHDRGITLQTEFFSTSTTLEVELFNCVLFYRTEFIFLLSTVAVFRSLKLLFAYFSSEVEVISRRCLSDVSSSPLFVRFSIVCFNNSIINVGMKFAR